MTRYRVVFDVLAEGGKAGSNGNRMHDIAKAAISAAKLEILPEERHQFRVSSQLEDGPSYWHIHSGERSEGCSNCIILASDKRAGTDEPDEDT